MIPAVLLVGLPRLLLQTGRYFDLGMLSRAIPELVVLLGICAALGLLETASFVSSYWLAHWPRAEVLRRNHRCTAVAEKSQVRAVQRA